MQYAAASDNDTHNSDSTDENTSDKSDWQTSQLYIADMCCPVESRMIESSLTPMPGVDTLSFNLVNRTLKVSHRADQGADILAGIRALGFQPEAMDAATQKLTGAALHSAPSPQDAEQDRKASLWLYLRLGVAVALALLAELLPLLIATHPFWLAPALSAVALLLCGLQTYKKGWQAIRQLDFNINALMSIAVTGALLIGHWPEAAMVMALFTCAELIEDRTLDRARQSIQALLSMAPQTALVQSDNGDWQQQATAQVRVGQHIRIRPGDNVPLDGVIIRGQSTLNQAAVTGESLAVFRQVGDSIFAGSLNEGGSLDVEVSADASHSTLARIRQAIEQAQAEKAPIQRFIDRFARIYTPAVMLISLLTALLTPLLLGWAWSEAVYRALIILVIACPCALIISTPVTIISGLSVAARNGLLIKGGLYLEQGRKLTAIAFDKTGTLTTGQPSIDALQLLGASVNDEAARDRMIATAAALASHSSHPVSNAVVEFARQQASHGPQLPVSDFHATTGIGIAGTVAGTAYQLGSPRLLTDDQRQALAPYTDDPTQGEQSALVLIAGDTPVALFSVVDRARDSSAGVIRELHQLGLKTLMLSGDSQARASQLAQQLGIDQAQGELLPEQKLSAIEQLQQHYRLGMVGDGINDGPALARAHIGFAMGAAGSDTALETADIALLNDNLEKLPWFIRLSRRTGTLLIQNLVLALGSKGVFMLLAVTGHATLWMAVFADVGTSMLVIMNGLRLLKFKG